MGMRMSLDTVARSAAAGLRSAAAGCDELAALESVNQRVAETRTTHRRLSWVAAVAVVALVAIAGWHLLPVNAESTPVSPSPGPTHGLGLSLAMTFQAPPGWHATTDGPYVRLVPDDGSERALSVVPAGQVFDPPSFRTVMPALDPRLWIVLHPDLDTRRVDTPYGPGWESAIYQVTMANGHSGTVPLVPLRGGPDRRLAVSPDDQTFWWGLLAVPGGTMIAAAESSVADDTETRDALYEVLRSIKIPRTR